MEQRLQPGSVILGSLSQLWHADGAYAALAAALHFKQELGKPAVRFVPNRTFAPCLVQDLQLQVRLDLGAGLAYHLDFSTHPCRVGKLSTSSTMWDHQGLCSNWQLQFAGQAPTSAASCDLWPAGGSSLAEPN